MYNGRETLQCHELVNTQLYFATKCDNKKQDLTKVNSTKQNNNNYNRSESVQFVLCIGLFMTYSAFVDNDIVLWRNSILAYVFMASYHRECICLQCFDAVGWATGRASGLVKTEWWGAGMVICLEQGADLHMAQLMPLPLTVSCFSKIQIGYLSGTGLPG